MEQEQERGHHHHRRRRPPSGALRTGFDQQPERFNIIDTPGHVDFTIEVERSCACSTARSALLSTQPGVEAADRDRLAAGRPLDVPRIVANKMDKIGADFFNCVR